MRKLTADVQFLKNGQVQSFTQHAEIRGRYNHAHKMQRWRQVQPCTQHAEIRSRYNHEHKMQRSGAGTVMLTRCRDPGRVQSCAQDAEDSRVSDPG